MSLTAAVADIVAGHQLHELYDFHQAKIAESERLRAGSAAALVW
jgi:hypothetical protein